MRAQKVDANQQEIVAALRAHGCEVSIIGQPVDLLVGYMGRNILIECKNPQGKNTLTKAQKDFISSWRGQVAVVRTANHAIKVVEENTEE